MNDTDFKRAWDNYGKPYHAKAQRPEQPKGNGTFAAPIAHNTPTGLPLGPQPEAKSDEELAADAAYDAMWNTQSRAPRYA